MSVLIFKLNGVSEQEAEDVRLLLEDHALEYYESSAGRWGLSVAALWLKNADQKALARQLIDDYQSARVERIHAELSEGDIQSIMARLKEAPLQMTAIMVVILLILYVSVAPFLGWL